MVGRREQVAIALHGHLNRRVASKGHQLLDRESLLDQERDGEVVQIVPSLRHLDLFLQLAKAPACWCAEGSRRATV